MAKHCETTDALNRFMEPLLSPNEEADESRRDAPMEEDPAASGLGETAGMGWQRVQHFDQHSLVQHFRSTQPRAVPQTKDPGFDSTIFQISRRMTTILTR